MLDEPLCSIVDEKEISEIFRQAVDNLIKAGKTVIVSSQNPSVSEMRKSFPLPIILLIFRYEQKIKMKSFAVITTM